MPAGRDRRRASSPPLDRRAAHDPITARLHARYVRARLTARGGRRAARRAGAARVGRTGRATRPASAASTCRPRRPCTAGVWPNSDVAGLRAGPAAAVFAAAERARAVSNRLPAVRPPEDPDAAELLAELRQMIETLHAAARTRQHRARAAPPSRLERRIAAGAGRCRPGRVRARSRRLDEVRRSAAPTTPASSMYVESAGDCRTRSSVGARLRLHALGAAAPVVEQVRRLRADLDVLAQPRLPARAAGRSAASLADDRLRGLDAALLSPARAATPRAGHRLDRRARAGCRGASLPWLRGVPVTVAPVGDRVAGRVRAQRRRNSRGGRSGRAGPARGRDAEIARGRDDLARCGDRRSPERTPTGRSVRSAIGGCPHPARRRARHAPDREPAVLVAAHGRRAGVRPRTGSHAPDTASTSCCRPASSAWPPCVPVTRPSG